MTMTMRYADSAFGAHHAPVTEPATTCAPAGSAPVTRSAWVTRRSNPLSALEKKKRTLMRLDNRTDYESVFLHAHFEPEL